MKHINHEKINAALGAALPDNFRVYSRTENPNPLQPPRDLFVMVEAPFYFSDGDGYQIYLEQTDAGVLRLSDKGNLAMRMSIDINLDLFYTGKFDTRRKQILAECDMREDDGELLLDTDAKELAADICKFAVGMTRLCELSAFIEREVCAACGKAVGPDDEFYQCANELCGKLVCDECSHNNESEGVKDEARGLNIVGRSALCKKCDGVVQEMDAGAGAE